MSERPVTFTREQIAEYAEASGDHNPIHLDEEFARTVGLPGVIAHGMLQMGLLASLLTHELGDHRRIRRLSVRFAGMVEPGDTVILGCGLEEGVAKLSALNQRGEAVLTKASARLQ